MQQPIFLTLTVTVLDATPPPRGVVIVQLRASSDGLDLGQFCKSASTATGKHQRLQGSTFVIWYEMASPAEAAALVKSARSFL